MEIRLCYCPSDMAACIRKVLVRPCVGVRVCHFLLFFFVPKPVNINQGLKVNEMFFTAFVLRGLG